MIEWTTNPLKQIFGMFDIRLLQASSSRLQKSQSFYVPGCYDVQLQSVRKAYMPNESNVVFEAHRINRRIINKRILLFGFLPLIPFVLSQYFQSGAFPFHFLLWPVLVVVGCIGNASATSLAKKASACKVVFL
jgi:hypothetical protein